MGPLLTSCDHVWTEQFIGTQKQAIGDLKSTIRIYQEMMRGSNSLQMEAWHIVAIPSLMQAYIQVGDLPQAEGLLRRTTALITKARTSGHPGWRRQYSIKGRMFESFFDNARAIVLEARANIARQRTRISARPIIEEAQSRISTRPKTWLPRPRC